MPAILNDIRDVPESTGIILSKDLRLEPTQIKPNTNVFVFGKDSNRPILANLLRGQESFIAADYEGGYYKECASKLTAMGYSVKCFDARSAIDCEIYSSENKYNPIKYMSCEEDAERLSAIMFKYSESRATYGDELAGFKNAKRKLLTAMIAYIYLTDRRFGTLCNLLRLTLPELEDKFSMLEKETYAYRCFMEFKTGADDIAKDLVASLAVRFHAFVFSDMPQLTMMDDINLANVGDKKTAVFVIYKIDDDGISEAFASMLLAQAVALSFRNHINIIIGNIDELYIASLPKIVGRCTAKSNFSVFITLDDINELWEMYGKTNSMKMLKEMGAVVYTGGGIDRDMNKWLNLFLWVKFPHIWGNSCAVIYGNDIYKDKCPKD